MWDIMPLGDIKEHSFGSTCECKPKIIESNGQLIANHKAFDNREVIEKLNKKHGFYNNLETNWGLYQ